MTPSRAALSTSVVAVLGALVTVPLAAPAWSAAETCQGRPATLEGSPSQTTLRGTEGDDVIVTGGSTEVDALGGDDLVCVSAGSDPVGVSAGSGDDAVRGEDGSVLGPVSLGSGADRVVLTDDVRATGAIDAGPGRDRLEVVATWVRAYLPRESLEFGPSGARSQVPLVGVQDLRIDGSDVRASGDGQPNDFEMAGCVYQVLGGKGDDSYRTIPRAESVPRACDGSETGPLFPDRAREFLGNEGADTAVAGLGSERLSGGPGDDVLRAGQVYSVMGGDAGDDLLVGGPRIDRLFGGQGDDVLRGGGSDDRLVAGAGRDSSFGGAGSDVCRGEEIRRSCER